MMKDSAYHDFIQTILDTEIVYTLQFFDGEFDEIAECGSAVYLDKYDEAVPVYCFWHREGDAIACQKAEWSEFEVVSVDLSSFISEVLINMDQDEVLVGVAFDSELYGLEIEPMDLLGDVLEEASAGNYELDVQNLEEILAYHTAWEKQMVGQTKLH